MDEIAKLPNNSMFLPGDNYSTINPHMRCTMTLNGKKSYTFEGHFSDRPRYPKICNDVISVERDSDDKQWTSVTFLGKKHSHQDSHGQDWQKGNTWYLTGSFEGNL